MWHLSLSFSLSGPKMSTLYATPHSSHQKKNELMETWGEMSLTNDSRGVISTENDSVALTHRRLQIEVGKSSANAVWKPHLLEEKQTQWQAHAANGDVASVADRQRWGTGGGGD